MTAESVTDKHPSIVSANMSLRYKRPFGVNYNPNIWKLRDKFQHMHRLVFWRALPSFRHSLKRSLLWRRISSEDDRLSKQHGQYMNRIFMARVKKKIGLRQQTLETKVELFILSKYCQKPLASSGPH